MTSVRIHTRVACVVGAIALLFHVAPVTAAGDDDPLAHRVEVRQHHVVFGVEDHGAGGDLDDQILAADAGQLTWV